MTPDPRIRITAEWISSYDQDWEPELTRNEAAIDMLSYLDAADRAAGVLRVDAAELEALRAELVTEREGHDADLRAEVQHLDKVLNQCNCGRPPRSHMHWHADQAMNPEDAELWARCARFLAEWNQMGEDPWIAYGLTKFRASDLSALLRLIVYPDGTHMRVYRRRETP